MVTKETKYFTFSHFSIWKLKKCGKMWKKIKCNNITWVKVDPIRIKWKEKWNIHYIGVVRITHWFRKIMEKSIKIGL